MPNPICGPRGALAPEVDAAAWAGVNLFTYNTGAPVTVAAPSTWATFDDVLAMLTGRGVDSTGQIDLAAELATASGTTVTVTIDADDRIVATFTGAVAVTLSASADNAVFGFDVAGQAAVAVGGNYVLTATSNWQRGNIQNAQLTVTRGASSGPAPSVAYQVHSVVHLLRPWGIGDADDAYPTTNVSALDAGSGGAAWGITADGHVWRAWDNRTALDFDGWSSTTFRDALGFDGTEAAVTTGFCDVLQANNPCRWLATPTRPFEATLRGRRRYGSSALATDRSAYLVEWMQTDEMMVKGFIDGPADRIDRQDHWLRQVWPHMQPGARINVYPDWSDGRRGRRSYDTATVASGGKVLPYSVLYTSQRDGEYGRWLMRRSVEDADSMMVEWPSRMRRRMPFDLRLHNYEGEQ